MKNIFHGLLIATPLAALVLFFSLTGKEEVKNDQRVLEATHTLEKQQFDDEFSDAWNGEPGAKIRKARQESVAELKAEVTKAKAKRDNLDKMFDDATSDMKAAIKDEDQRLSGKQAKKPKDGLELPSDEDPRLLSKK